MEDRDDEVQIGNAALPTDAISEVLLETDDNNQSDLMQQLRDLVNPFQMTRTQTEDFANMYYTPFFLQMAFCNIFPYGRGGPDKENTGVEWNESYVIHVLQLGELFCCCIFY
jgi:hypothetical protein